MYLSPWDGLGCKHLKEGIKTAIEELQEKLREDQGTVKINFYITWSDDHTSADKYKTTIRGSP